MQFVDIKNDIAFRKIFGNENKKIILISFLNAVMKLEVVPENVDDEGLKAAYQDANKHSWTKEELEAYDYAAMREQDERGKLVQAEKRGILKVAKTMKEKGMDAFSISELTGLSNTEIESI